MKGLLAVAAILLSTTLSAQLEFGFLAGINMATQQASYNQPTRISVSNSFDFKVHPVSGLNLGLLVQTNIMERLDLKFTVLYSEKGQRERTTRASTGGYEFKDKLKYLEIPVELVYNLGQKQHHGLFLALGIYAARPLWGNSHFYDYGNDYGQDCDVDIAKNISNWRPLTLYVKPIDIGLRTGIGYRFQSYMITLSNGYGLVNNLPQVSNTAGNPLAEYINQSTRKNVCWTLSVGYIPFLLEGDQSRK